MALATVTVVNNRVVVQPFGSELLTPLVGQATTAAESAAADAVATAADRVQTGLDRVQTTADAAATAADLADALAIQALGDDAVAIAARAAKAANGGDFASLPGVRANLMILRQHSVEAYLDPARVPGVTDDALAFQAACDAALASGARAVAVPRLATDYYFATKVTVKPGEGRFEITGYGSPTIEALSTLNGSVFEFEQEDGGGDYPQNIWWRGINLRSGPEATISSAKVDGNNFIGLRFGLLANYLRVYDCRFAGFSRAGIQLNQSVDVRCINVDFSNCYRGREWAKNPTTNDPCADAIVEGGYVSGCTSGDYAENGLTAFVFIKVVNEYCGDPLDEEAEEAGFRIRGGTGTIVVPPYAEANYRNIWVVDCILSTLGNNFSGTATWADVFEWEGVAGEDRGYGALNNRTLTITEIAPDATTNPNGLTVLGNIGVNTPAIAGVQCHLSGPEARFRLTATNPGGQSWEPVSGGGGVGSAGYFGIYDVTNGAIRFEIAPGTGKLAITGSTTSMEVSLNGSRVLATPQTGWAAMAGTATKGGFDTAAVTLPQLAQVVKALIDAGLQQKPIAT